MKPGSWPNIIQIAPSQVSDRDYVHFWNLMSWASTDHVSLSINAFFRLPSEYSIMFCWQHSMAFLIQSSKLFHILLTQQFQGPKNHMVMFITAITTFLVTKFFSGCCVCPLSPQCPPSLLPTGSPLLITTSQPTVPEEEPCRPEDTLTTRTPGPQLWWRTLTWTRGHSSCQNSSPQLKQKPPVD